MPRKTVGYVHLVWRCPNCNQFNSGIEKTCDTCGSPQPEDVEFESPPKQEVSKDESLAEEVRKGVDIHCPYCHTRNEADAIECIQCGGDLTGGKQREKGRIVGSPGEDQAGEVTCLACGTVNPSGNLQCNSCGGSLAQKPSQTGKRSMKPLPGTLTKRSPIKTIGLVAVLLLLGVICIAAIGFITRTSDVEGTVSGLQWNRQIAVMQIQPVNHKDWIDNIPGDARIGTCTQELYDVQDQPSVNSHEVCGTAYTVDTGTGIGEVVQDCQYEIYIDYCEYTVQEWAIVDVMKTSGQDSNPYWPDLYLSADQQQGEMDETYKISFSTDKGLLEYDTSDVTEFQQFPLGSEWVLEVSTLGGISSYQRK